MTQFDDNTYVAEVWNGSQQHDWNKLDISFKGSGAITCEKTMYGNGSFSVTAYSNQGDTAFKHNGNWVNFTSVTEQFDRSGNALGTKYTCYDGSSASYSGSQGTVNDYKDGIYGAFVSNYIQVDARQMPAISSDGGGLSTLFGGSQIGKQWQDVNVGLPDLKSTSGNAFTDPKPHFGYVGTINDNTNFYFNAFGSGGSYGAQAGVGISF